VSDPGGRRSVVSHIERAEAVRSWALNAPRRLRPFDQGHDGACPSTDLRCRGALALRWNGRHSPQTAATCCSPLKPAGAVLGHSLGRWVRRSAFRHSSHENPRASSPSRCPRSKRRHSCRRPRSRPAPNFSARAEVAPTALPRMVRLPRRTNDGDRNILGRFGVATTLLGECASFSPAQSGIASQRNLDSLP
jgi:hypothetical protein